MSLYKKNYNPYDDYSDEPDIRPSRIVCTCAECGEPIQIGEQYIDIDGDCYCEFCIDDMTKNEVLELAGLTFQTADID